MQWSMAVLWAGSGGEGTVVVHLDKGLWASAFGGGF